MTLIALLVLLVLVQAALFTIVLAIYDEETFRDAWSRVWSKPWFPIIVTLFLLIGEAL